MTHRNHVGWRMAAALVLSVGWIGMTGCESDSAESHLGDGYDFGANDANVYVAFGDSITEGALLDDPGTQGYVSKLAVLLGKTVVNEGVGGSSTYDGVDWVHGVLDDHRPGFLLIYYGVNDLIASYDEEDAAANLRSIIQAARDNKTLPVIATLTPVEGEHGAWSSGVDRLNALIRQLAAELDVPLVDLNEAFGVTASTYLLSDGLHPNALGHTLIADTFYDVVK